MTPDPFEQRLSRQPLRPVPAEWRDETLPRAGDLQSPSLASAMAPDGGCKPPAQFSGSSPISYLPSPAPLWRDWLWPCPQAWAALAAVWVLALFFHVTAPKVAPAAPRVAMQATPQQLLALLRTGSSPPAEVPEVRQKPTTLSPGTPKPRSERRALVVAA